MVRGVVPRQPAKTGRQEGTRKGFVRPQAVPGRAKANHRPGAKASNKPNAAKRAGGKPPAGYNPVGPERVREILKRLDQLYPNVTCALGHKSAWELLVSTILSDRKSVV